MHRKIATDTKLYITLKLTLVFGEIRVGYLFIIDGGYPPTHIHKIKSASSEVIDLDFLLN